MSYTHNIVVLGDAGQIGWELQRTLSSVGTVHSFDLPTLDLLDAQAVRQTLKALRPVVIVNAAAYTAVDRAEVEQEMSMRLNAEVPGLLGSIAADLGSLLIHYSTDYVFDGTATTPYREAFPTSPLNAYGATKLAGEKAVRMSDAPHIILRTSWIYAARGKNFLLTMLDLANRRQQLSIVDDQVGAPTWARLVAQATAHVVHSYMKAPNPEGLLGTYHLTCRGQTSWYHFAEAIFRHRDTIAAKYGLELPPAPTLTPISTSQYPTPAARPAYSMLDNTKFNTTFGICMPDWETALKLCLHELLAAQRQHAPCQHALSGALA